MAHQSFRKDVLDKTLGLAAANGGEINANKVSVALAIMTRKEHKRLLNTLSALAGEGKLHRVRQGVYGAPSTSAPPEKREIMWRLLRINKRTTLDDLVELAGVGKDYARAWLAMLVKHEVVKRLDHPGAKTVWMLVSDRVEMPVSDDRAAYLREMRRQKKEVIATQLDVIIVSLAEVRKTLATLEVE